MSACTTLNTYSNLVSCAIGIINSVIPVIVAITVLYIIWGAFNLTKSEGEDRKKWGQVILYGVVGLFIMVSIYGIVNILVGTFGFGANSITTPNISVGVQSPVSPGNIIMSTPTNSSQAPVTSQNSPFQAP